MGNYYSGMMNNKDGYGELRHYRTKGSKNGISTTPGYIAIGEKAQDVRVKPKTNYSQKANILDNAFEPIKKYKKLYDHVGQVVREYGPKAVSYAGNGAREFARNSSELAKGVARGSKMLAEGVGRDIRNLGSTIHKATKKLGENTPDWYNDYKNNRDKYSYSGTEGKIKLVGDALKAANKVGEKMVNSYNKYRHGNKKETNYMKNYYQEIGGLLGSNYDNEDLPKAEVKARKITDSNIKENKLRDEYIKAEKYCTDLVKKYEAAVSKSDVDEIERLTTPLNEAYDKYIEAQNNYQGYRFSSNKYK